MSDQAAASAQRVAYALTSAKRSEEKVLYNQFHTVFVFPVSHTFAKDMLTDLGLHLMKQEQLCAYRPSYRIFIFFRTHSMPSHLDRLPKNVLTWT